MEGVHTYMNRISPETMTWGYSGGTGTKPGPVIISGGDPTLGWHGAGILGIHPSCEDTPCPTRRIAPDSQTVGGMRGGTR